MCPGACLQGNPLCEEPEYRLLVIHAIPSLKVLDQHAVTPAGKDNMGAEYLP